MKKFVLSAIAAFMFLAMPSVAFAAVNDDNGNAMRGNQFVNRFNDTTDTNGNVMNRRGMTGAGTNGFQNMNTNNRFNANNDWNNNMTTRTVGNGTMRTNAAADNGTDWGWLGLLGLIGLAGMMGRGRDRGDAK